jgi:quinol monooxygenase YgiN
MFYLNVVLKVKNPERAGMVRDSFAKMAPLCRSEEGCLRWEAYQSESEPSVFVLNEHWETREVWEQHLQGYALLEIYKKTVLPEVEREVHPSSLIGLE